MKPLRVILDVFKDEPTGEIGLKLEGAPASDEMFAAREGRLIAHDLLEHVNGPEVIGDIGDELEALGAIWYVRGRHSDLSRDGVGSAFGPHENVASDVSEMAIKSISSGEMVTTPRTRAHEADDDFRDIIEHATKSAREEWRAQNDSEIDAGDLAHYMRAALGRMRTGYRKAARKYAAVNVNAAFWAIAGAVDKVTGGRVRYPYERTTGAELYEGAQFELTYNWDTGRATCFEHYPEEDDYT